MANGATFGRRASPRVTIQVALGALALLALWFIARNALRYVHYDASTYDDFWPRRFGLIPHAGAGVVALLLGLVQLWLGLSGRTGPLHRLLGRIYLGAIAVGAVAGMYLATTTVYPPTFAYRSGLFLLAVAWLIASAMAWIAVRRGAYEQHREWMIRSFIITFAFVSFRFIVRIIHGLGMEFTDDFAGALAWGCWVVPLMIAEPLLHWRKLGQR
jgi:uncharacterized membrane protein